MDMYSGNNENAGPNCPVCIKPMQKRKLFNTEVDMCRFCAGVWLDSGELSGFIEQGKVPTPILKGVPIDNSHMKAREGERKCPKCGKILDVIQHMGVNVDACSGCYGLWFDRGEIMTILRGYYNEVNPKGSPLSNMNAQENMEIDDDDVIRIDMSDDGFVQRMKIDKVEMNEAEAKNILEAELLVAGDKTKIARSIPKNLVEEEHKNPFQLGPENKSSLLSTHSMHESHPMMMGGFGGLGGRHRSSGGEDIAEALIGFVVSLFSGRRGW